MNEILDKNILLEIVKSDLNHKEQQLSIQLADATEREKKVMKQLEDEQIKMRKQHEDELMKIIKQHEEEQIKIKKQFDDEEIKTKKELDSTVGELTQLKAKLALEEKGMFNFISSFYCIIILFAFIINEQIYRFNIYNKTTAGV